MIISVVTRTRNRQEYLLRACDSICAQTFRSFVWSIVNDGGARDGIDDIAARAEAAGIETCVTHLEETTGRASAANTGVKACASDAIILLDDDDRFLDNALETLAKGLEQAPQGDVGIAAQVYQVEEKKGTSGAWEETARSIANPQRGPITIVELAYRNFLPVNGFLYWRSAYDAVGGYDESLPVVEDWDLNLKLIQLGDIGKINAPVAEYFVRPDLDDPDTPDANSVSAGHSLHEEYAARLRNRYLRRDLEAGVTGIGHLMNPSHRLPMERINALADGMNRAARRNWLVRKLLSAVRAR